MTMTAQGREAEYGDELGRCETCGLYVAEDQLTETPDGVECPECFAIDE